MSIASDLLHSLQQAWAGRPKPRVRALHLPPVPWNGSKDGEFGAIELDSGALGLSYLLLDDALARVSAASRAGADHKAQLDPGVPCAFTHGRRGQRALIGFTGHRRRA